LLPTFLDILKRPSLLWEPVTLSQTFMAHVWVTFGPATDEGAAKTKAGLITPHARGVVLDIGAGE
jgi:hypothetical protein